MKEEKKKPNGYWTLEKIQTEALKYSSRGEFQKNNKSAYSVAVHKKMIDDVCSHMILLKKPCNYWTYETIKEEALKYNTKKEFREKNSGVCNKAIKMKIMDDVCSHMIVLHRKNGYWTPKRIKKEALKYNSKWEFIKNSPGAYNRAYKSKILEDVCSHMD